jgi:uncharacterized alpha-E superfamily protein
MLMLARNAERLYWMSRYLERAEDTARLINSSTLVLLDLPAGASFGWRTLLEVAGVDDLFRQRYGEADEDAIMRFLIEDEHNPSSVYACVSQARENCRTLREMLPAEVWEHINSLYLYIKAHAGRACRNRRERYLVLNDVIERRHAIVGVVAGVMGHDLPYQMMKLGRNLERADMTTRILDLNAAVHYPAEPVLCASLQGRIWISILESLSAYPSYRRLVSMDIATDSVVAFLLNDSRFPRSVVHCLIEMEGCLRDLPRSQQLSQQLVQLRQEVGRHPTQGLDTLALHEYLDLLQAQLGMIHATLIESHFHVVQAEPMPEQGAASLTGQ